MPTWTKRHIVDGFVRLLHKHSYPSITVEMILAQTDVSKTTFYRYFRNKSDVMDAYFQQVYDAAILDEGCRDLEDLFAAILEKARSNPEQYRMFETTGYNSYLRFIYRYTFSMGSRIIETAWKRSLSEAESLHVAFFCAGGSHMTVEEIPAPQFAFLKSLFFTYYGPTVIEVTERLGLDYDEYRCDVEQVMADAEVTTPNAHIMPGTIGTHHFVMATYDHGREVVGFHFNHKGSNEILADYTVDKAIEIFGEPHVRVDIDGIIDHEDPFLTSAAPNVNLIPAIVDAEPGYQDALDIPFGRVPR
ncbi:TetR family transcriptional regulator [Olsenella phocaeensis]|uniref:TetR family transcriptional regulator n=1 Tax=Olsenella phocaeensis TaxID=1852385 RepID=UPI00092FE4E5|nr:TetR family transcriptional regulator [Olsenella phocaeensis]